MTPWFSVPAPALDKAMVLVSALGACLLLVALVSLWILRP